MTAVKRFYLACYNSCMAVGWACLAVQVVSDLLQHGTGQTTSRSSSLASGLQWLSLLETLHAALRIVPSGVVNNTLQWVGRAHALFCVVQPEAGLRESLVSSLLLLAWSLGETCRYPMCASMYSSAGSRC